MASLQIGLWITVHHFSSSFIQHFHSKSSIILWTHVSVARHIRFQVALNELKLNRELRAELGSNLDFSAVVWYKFSTFQIIFGSPNTHLGGPKCEPNVDRIWKAESALASSYINDQEYQQGFRCVLHQ